MARLVMEIHHRLPIWMIPPFLLVDDLACALLDPAAFIKELSEVYGFKLKGTGPIEFHLGCDFYRDSDGVLCISPKKHIDKMVDSYERIFGSKPLQKYRSPLDKGDHPETDTTELLGQDDIAVYQSMIGSLQWTVSLARIDIATAVMTMSGFRTAPRVGHLERLKRVYGYLSKFQHGVLRFRTNEPDYSDLADQDFDWMYTVYGNVQEFLPSDAPQPLGKPVLISHYLDANLFHVILTDRSVTGILTLPNASPADWYTKKQATVETATYGSEFAASRTCVERDIDLRNTLRYLGVPVRKKAYMFGDNESVVNSSITPHAKLHKRHTALSFHRVREAIAARTIAYHHLRSESNVADMLSKHWGHGPTWPLLQPLMFWEGDTIDLHLYPDSSKAKKKPAEVKD